MAVNIFERYGIKEVANVFEKLYKKGDIGISGKHVFQEPPSPFHKNASHFLSFCSVL